jgi:hypothetical protein
MGKQYAARAPRCACDHTCSCGDTWTCVTKPFWYLLAGQIAGMVIGATGNVALMIVAAGETLAAALLFALFAKWSAGWGQQGGE